MRFIYLLSVILVAFLLTYSQTLLFNSDTGLVVDTIPVRKDAFHMVSTLKSFNYAYDWNESDRRLKFFKKNKKSDTLEIIPDNHFALIGNFSYQFCIPPFFENRRVYLEPNEFAVLLKKILNKTVVYNDSMNAIICGNVTLNSTFSTKSLTSAKQSTIPESLLVETAVPRKNGKLHIRRVVIDPGHGGKDPGAIGQNGVKEKDIVLAIALELNKLLKKDTSITVFMTRSTDVFIPLRERTRFANNKKADLFVSIHANSIAGDKKKRDRIKGYKTYFLSQAKNEDDKRAALFENSVIKLEDNSNSKKFNYLQTILNDMANNEYLKESQNLAIEVKKSLASVLGSESNPLQKGVGQANFWVLNGAYMPSILVETDFISNTLREKKLNTKKYQKKIALAIYKAIISLKKKYEGNI